jgi:hypothetical protein
MTETFVIKNKIRLQLRKTRQRVLKNVKRDISKYADKKAANQELLEGVKKANIETVLHIVLTKYYEDKKGEKSTEKNVGGAEEKIEKIEKPLENPEQNETQTPENPVTEQFDFTLGEKRIAAVFLNSEQKSLTDGLGNTLDKFRADRKPKETKSIREGQKKRIEKKKLENPEKGDDNAPKRSDTVENEDTSVSKSDTTSKSDKKSEKPKSEKPAKPAKKVKGENIHKPEPLKPLEISTFKLEIPEQIESPSTDDSFFIDENPSKPKKPKQIREERRDRTKNKIQEQRLTRDVAMISNSRFGQDKKRAYHERQDLYEKQKEKNNFLDKSNVRAEYGTSQPQRREPQLSAQEQTMHPS